MVDVEQITEIAMNIITYAGLAKSNYLQGLDAYKKGKEEEADIFFTEGDNNFVKAHGFHGNLIAKETETRIPQITLVLSHAEDQLMNAEMINIMVNEFIELYKKDRR